MSPRDNELNFEQIADQTERSLTSRNAHHRPGLDWLAPVVESNQVTTPSRDALLVGPADRYDVGEMLRPHVLTRVLNFSRFRCAGLVGADLTRHGGHSVRTYGESALEMTGQNLELVHHGGDVLGVNLVDGYRAAIREEEAERFESLSLLRQDGELSDFVKRRSGQLDDFAYVLASEGEFYGSRSSFHAVGLSDPDSLSPETADRLVSLLRTANFVGVRDEAGADFLESRNVSVTRMPCPLNVLPQVCARQLREFRDCAALEEIRNRFPNGWIAVEVGQVLPGQFQRLTSALREIAERNHLGIVFFDATCDKESSMEMRRWVEAFPEWIAAEFGSSQIWAVASMLLHSRLYCGTSLDCRIICMSGGVARINIPTGKASALSYCELWEHDNVPIEFSEDEEWIVALEEAFSVDLSLLQEHAAWLHRTYFSSLEKFCAATGIYPRLMQEDDKVTSHQEVAASLHHLHDEWLSDEESLRTFRRLNRKSGRRRTVSGLRVIRRLSGRKEKA